MGKSCLRHRCSVACSSLARGRADALLEASDTPSVTLKAAAISAEYLACTGTVLRTGWTVARHPRMGAAE